MYVSYFKKILIHAYESFFETSLKVLPSLTKVVQLQNKLATSISVEH